MGDFSEGFVVDYVEVAETHGYFHVAVFFGVDGVFLFFFGGVASAPCYIVYIAEGVDVDYVGVCWGKDEVLD